jgi:hypothetical protein
MENIMDEIINQLTAKVKLARELQIIAALKRHGFEFETADELHSFVRDRCTLVTGYEGRQRLYVEDAVGVKILVMEWNTTPSVEYFGDKITVTL